MDYLEKEALSIYEENKESIISETGNIEDLEFHFSDFDNPIITNMIMNMMTKIM